MGGTCTGVCRNSSAQVVGCINARTWPILIERDFILRQVHQLAHALARVISLDAARRHTEGQEMLSLVVQDITGVDLLRLRESSRAELRTLCSRDGGFSPDLAVALADVLMEDSRFHHSSGNQRTSDASRRRSLWLYELARDEGGTLPMDILQMLSG